MRKFWPGNCTSKIKKAGRKTEKKGEKKKEVLGVGKCWWGYM